ncbi:MAG TPA: ATP-binding protein, partial [Polyangiaceae bacterium]|nr:ATP-binding protein [Polyangiaceae bacterium]
MSNAPSETSATPTPYRTALEHLGDRIAHANDLTAAYAARMAAEEAPRERPCRRAELLRRAQQRSAAALPVEVRQLWELADRRLAELRRREVATAEIGLELPLVELERRFRLSEVEVEALVLALASQVDPTFRTEWERRCPDVINLDVRAATAVLARTFPEAVGLRRIFTRDAPLVDNSLLLLDLRRGRSESDFLQLDLEVPRRIVSLVLAEAGQVDETSAFSCLQRPTVSLEQVVLPPETIALVRGVIEHHSEFVAARQRWGLDDAIGYGRGTLLLFVGEPGVGKTMLAQAIARELGKRLFVVDAVKLVTEAGRSVEGMLDAVFREAVLLDAVLFFDEAEQIFESRTRGNELMSVLLTRLERFEGVGILATNMVEALDPAIFRRMLATIRFERPTAGQRAEIWRRHLPPALPLGADVEVRELAERYDLTGGLIKNAVLVAAHTVVAKGRAQITQADLEQGARAQLLSAFPIGAAGVERPEIGLDDLVFPPAVTARVARFIQAARVRTTVLEEWGLRRALGGQAGAVAL